MTKKVRRVLTQSSPIANSTFFDKPPMPPSLQSRISHRRQRRVLSFPNLFHHKKLPVQGSPDQTRQCHLIGSPALIIKWPMLCRYTSPDTL